MRKNLFETLAISLNENKQTAAVISNHCNSLHTEKKKKKTKRDKLNRHSYRTKLISLSRRVTMIIKRDSHSINNESRKPFHPAAPSCSSIDIVIPSIFTGWYLRALTSHETSKSSFLQLHTLI